MSSPIKIAVLISGGGTTLKNLIDRIADGSLNAEIDLVIASRSSAGGLRFAEEASIEAKIIPYKHFNDRQSFSDEVFDAIRQTESNLIVMGGFLRQLSIPDDYENKIINIHPSLIPAFSGKGFYGSRVHQSVLDYGCKLTGCTVHYVDDEYDHGPIIAQKSVSVETGDDVKALAQRVFDAECELLPAVINQIADGVVVVEGRVVSTANKR